MLSAMQQIGYDLQIWFDYRFSFVKCFLCFIGTSAIWKEERRGFFLAKSFAKREKLERLKFAILFTIIDEFWAKKDKCMLPEDGKIRSRYFIHPSSFIHLCKHFIHQVKKHCFRLSKNSNYCR